MAALPPAFPKIPGLAACAEWRESSVRSVLTCRSFWGELSSVSGGINALPPFFALGRVRGGGGSPQQEGQARLQCLKDSLVAAATDLLRRSLSPPLPTAQTAPLGGWTAAAVPTPSALPRRCAQCNAMQWDSARKSLPVALPAPPPHRAWQCSEARSWLLSLTHCSPFLCPKSFDTSALAVFI